MNDTGGGDGEGVAQMSTDDALKKAEELKLQMQRLKATMGKKKKSKKRKANAAELGNVAEAGVNKRTAVGKNDSSRGTFPVPATAAAAQAGPVTEETSAIPTVTKMSSNVSSESVGNLKLNPYLAHLRGNGGGDDDSNIVDSWARKKALREERAFKIVPQGQYIKSAELQREREARQAFIRNRKDQDARRHFKQLLAKKAGVTQPSEASPSSLQSSSSSSSSSLSSSSSSSLPSSKATTLKLSPVAATVAVATAIKPASVPDLEWWDKPFLPSGDKRTVYKKCKLDSSGASSNSTCSFSALRIEHEKTFNLIEHPKYVTPLVEPVAAREIPLYMTKDERKRLRRQTRRAREQLQQDKIAAGLIPPPPPKVKLGNMMRVLGDLVVADPSKLEAYVKGQTAARVRSHNLRNAAAKLTPLEKFEKQQAKVAMDARAGSLSAAVYRVSDLCDPSDVAAANRFKMDVHAQKLGVTGCVIIPAEPLELVDGLVKRVTAVIAEGGPKALRKFDKELRRVKFPEPDGCVKLWQGVIASRVFPKRLEFHDLEPRAIKPFVQKHALSHYWEMAKDMQHPTLPV